MKKILENVVKLLEKHPNLRNDDTDLVIMYWKSFDKVNLQKPDYPITSPRTITRIRQKLQSKGYFLPTDQKVIEERRKQKVRIRTWLGYNPEEYSGD